MITRERVSFTLTTEGRIRLTTLAEHMGIPRSAVVEILIRDRHFELGLNTTASAAGRTVGEDQFERNQKAREDRRRSAEEEAGL